MCVLQLSQRGKIVSQASIINHLTHPLATLSPPSCCQHAMMRFSTHKQLAPVTGQCKAPSLHALRKLARKQHCHHPPPAQQAS